MSNGNQSAGVPLSTGKTQRRKRNSVTREEFLTMALQIVDTEGLDALSMRNLAARLQTGPMRAYRHFESKEALLEALADEQAQRIRAIEVPHHLSPPDMLFELGVRTRELLLEHPNLAPVVVSRPLSKATAKEDLIATGVFLRLAGFADEQVPEVSAGLTAYTLGFVLYELGQRQFHSQARAELLAYYDDLERESEGNALLMSQIAGIKYAVDNDWGTVQFKSGFRALIDGYWSQRPQSLR